MTFYSKVNENDIERRKKEFNDLPGVYILRSGTPTSPNPVHRAGGVDKDGVLYVGMSSLLRSARVSELKKSLSPTSPTTGHSAGMRYNQNDALKERFPYDELFIELIPSVTREEAGSKEGILLKEYLDKFGEVPPLNRTK
ncbi:hypothetical protein BCT06_14150 [Vibrio breoganii]|nr:hypothetical protein BCU49_15440 [Vibrio breoganii]PMO59807.1 hypothetical protein BCT06_14150 [Vibrio breoganii]